MNLGPGQPNFDPKVVRTQSILHPIVLLQSVPLFLRPAFPLLFLLFFSRFVTLLGLIE
jgi:hypothetical protein